MFLFYVDLFGLLVVFFSPYILMQGHFNWFGFFGFIQRIHPSFEYGLDGFVVVNPIT